ncbi:hypothetical protein DKP78_25255, partial [Enterococcus faecium]
AAVPRLPGDPAHRQSSGDADRHRHRADVGDGHELNRRDGDAARRHVRGLHRLAVHHSGDVSAVPGAHAGKGGGALCPGT